MTVPLPRATEVRNDSGDPVADNVRLDYTARLLRRKRLVTESKFEFLIDLAQVTSLNHGDRIMLEDGSAIGVIAALEPLVAIEGPSLTRFAWHIGNRHTPCEISAHRLVIRREPVMEKMLTGLGASLTPFMGPFQPEGGAYGHGRTLAHSHG